MMLPGYFRNRKKESLPLFIERYLAKFANGKEHDKTVEETEFVIFDTECSGLNIRKDHILSIGAIKLKNYSVDINSAFEVYIRQSESIPDSVGIHGILPNGKEEKLDEFKALEQFLDYIGTSVIVGHNVEFDIAMLNKVLKQHYGMKIKNQILDTAKMFSRVKGGDRSVAKPVSLDELCSEFKIPVSDRHTASGDAYITAILFMKLLKRLEQRGVNNLRDLLKGNSRLL